MGSLISQTTTPTPTVSGPGTLFPSNSIPGVTTPSVKVHFTGPVYHFIELPSTFTSSFESAPAFSAAYFLGTSEFSPRIRFNTYWDAIRMNQLYGSRVPGDKTFQGKSAQIYTELNIYSEEVLQILEAAPRGGFSTRDTSGGRYSANDVGALLIGDRCYFGLHLIFSVAGKSITDGSAFPTTTEDILFQVGATPVGYRFMYCNMLSMYSTGGSGQELKRMLIIDAMAARRQCLFSDGQQPPLNHYFELYDHKVLSSNQLANQVVWSIQNDYTSYVAENNTSDNITTIDDTEDDNDDSADNQIDSPPFDFSPGLPMPTYNPYEK